MPAGLGIKSVLAVFTSETYKEEAYAAGADIAGEEAM
jgi:ribosomal protein L1